MTTSIEGYMLDKGTFHSHGMNVIQTMLIEILNPAVGEQIASLVSGMDYLCYKILESGEIVRIELLSQVKPGGNFLFLNAEKHGKLIPEILKQP